LLDLSFFRPKPLTQILHDLGISRATYYRPSHRPRAIRELEKRLIEQHKPALHLELPPKPAHPLIGRDALIAECLHHLRAGNGVALSGQGGMGKTMIGAHITAVWEPGPVFWITFRAGLNDHLNTLLFSLAYFLHSHGASALWLQLVADNGRIKMELVPGLVQHDLENLQKTRALLCFDEIGLLVPTEIEAHLQIVTFLNTLGKLAPVLVMGQHIPLEPSIQLKITGLPPTQTELLLAQDHISLSPAELETVHTYTQGNPRLLKLFTALHRSGEPLSQLLVQLAASPTVEYLLNRIWQRLAAEEQNLLAAIAVFRRPAPQDAWQSQHHSLQNLYKHDLLQIDDRGGITLLPAFKDVIYHSFIPPEELEFYHLAAAEIRAQHGEYTAAAYHYIRGNQPQLAIWQWYTHRDQEINQGQGMSALTLFATLSHKQLPNPEKEILLLLRSELRLLVGDYAKIKEDLHKTLWEEPLLKTQAKRIEGTIAYELSRFDEALQAYRAGLDSLATVNKEAALLHKQVGEVYWQKRNLEQAWHESQLARYEVDHLQGDIQQGLGNYAEAHTFYQNALTLAQHIGYVEGEGRTRNNVAWLLLRQGDSETANYHWDIAIQCYEQVGRLAWLAGIKINQAGVYMDTGESQTAVPLLEEAVSVYEKLAHPRGLATAAINLAEAHLNLCNLETAEQYAWQSLQLAEPGLMPANFGVLARIKLDQNDLEEAKLYAHKSLALAAQNQDTYMAAYSWRTLGQVYLVENRPAEARTAFHQSLALFEDLGLTVEIDKTNRLMVDQHAL
jgi:tetratricopeptide (TPR) repeat protein